MPDSAPGMRRGWCLLLVLALSACAPATPPDWAPSPEPLTEAEVTELSTILALEDERRFEVPRLQELTASGSGRVRTRAALALGRLRRAEAIPLLTTLLGDPDTAVVATAAFALGQLGDTSAVPALAALLTDSVAALRPTVASEVASALGRVRSERARLALTDFLSPGPADREPIRAAVGSALLAVWRFPRPPELEPIRRWTAAGDPELRWRATYALVRRADPRATATLLQLAGDPEARVRALALRGLTAPLVDSAGVEHSVALPILLQALADPDYTVRINAARTLGTHAASEVVDALRLLLHSPDPHLALVAVESLGRIGHSARGAVSELRTLAASDAARAGLRQAALDALVRVSREDAVTLADGFRSQPGWRLRAAAGRAFAGAGVPVDPRAMSLIRDPDARVAAATLQALIEAAGDSLVPLRSLLLEQLGASDAMVRAAALGALGKIPDPASLPMLLDAYGRAAHGDSLNDAALAALDALAALKNQGPDPARALFARFSRPDDHLLRLRATEHFGEAARLAWGDPLPLRVPRPPDDYRRLVRAYTSSPEVVIETDLGAITLALFADAAPLTTESFLRLSAQGYFDGQEWPRVVPNFVVQGGDPRGDTSGGPGYTIRDEINRHRYLEGTLGMALSGPDTGGSQFFLTHSSQPHLDGVYTVFGKIVAGQEVTERLLPGDLIRGVRVLP